MAGDMLRFATGGSMIKSEEDFVLSTEYERFILSQLYPLMPASEKFDELDLRDAEGAHHIIRATLDVSGGKAEVLKQSLAPLAFMSAWKIVDLFIELYLHKSGETPGKNNQWDIAEKRRKSTKAVVPHLTPELWEGVCAIYGTTVEHRHCMVHRRASYTRRGLAASDRQGNPLTTLTPGELDAFIRLAQLLAGTVVDSRTDKRSLRQLRYLLFRLGQHIESDFSGGVALGPVTLVRAELVKNERGKLEADFAAIRAKKQCSVPHGPADVLLDIPGESGYRLFARLEELPDAVVTLDPDDLPKYLSRY